MRTIGYLRVSTEDQDHGVDAQRAAIERHVQPDEWREERASGKNLTDRPVLQSVLDEVCATQGLLVVAKLDRIGRSVVDVLQIFARLHECGASVRVIDMGIDTTTPSGKMMLTVLAAFAEFEREMISQRTREGLEAARASGVRLGRPPTVDHERIAQMLTEDRYTDAEIARRVGCSVRTVQRVKRA